MMHALGLRRNGSRISEEQQHMSSEAARQIFWTDDSSLPYIDFNTNGVRSKSTYFKTNYKPNAQTTVEICFGCLPACALDTGH